MSAYRVDPTTKAAESQPSSVSVSADCSRWAPAVRAGRVQRPLDSRAHRGLQLGDKLKVSNRRWTSQSVAAHPTHLASSDV